MSNLCGAKNPVIGTACVAKIRHIHHRDEAGRQWSAQDPDYIISQAQLMDDLRELLSYCYVEAGCTDGGAADVYTDIGMRLKEILDGEQ